ncbi:GGDEF domain-containing protein [Micromonospora craniellae]|uniref:GGDEF domain-containing protein n=1 Tax=Micromonospora craniellae TaxID=2294034 RepID=A0A372FUE1_9ACTN|nr:GGDEF domain-containing protein [Micromonospora craniellae]QOC89702.1 GGDEF domain-containing protein [Micromonospora craniellae]RFS44176.1 GGDEF domain-containing protein [Micromonospora craniellae]
MSHLNSYLTAAGGLLAGLAAAAPLLAWQRQIIHQQRQALAARERDLSYWRDLATHSDTTDLPNRRALQANLEAAFSLGEPLGLVLIDLDRFKWVNDTYGHEHGNALLYQVGERLATLKPPAVLVTHLSGDEFAVVVHGDEAEVEEVAHAAYVLISGTPNTVDDQQLTLTASVGYAVAEPYMLPRDLLHAADQAMYLAKARRSGAHAHDPSHHTPPGAVTRYRDLR